MDEFVRQHGLVAVYLGMWLEGETVLVISGFLAHQHVFDFAAVAPVAILGALTIDNVVFLCGHTLGGRPFFQSWLARHPEASSKLARFGRSWAGFFSVRFVYGTRMPYLFLLGSQRLGWPAFLARELPAVTIWCTVWLFFGHAIGNVIVLAYGEIRHHHRPWIVLALAAAGLATAGLLALRRRRGRRGAVAAG